MSITTIRSEFTVRLMNWADSQTPPISVSLENESFDKPSDKESFLEMFLLPALTINPTLDGVNKREVGICQINCWVWDDGRGVGESDRLAQSIVNLFPVIPKFSPVSVERTPTISRPIKQDGWSIRPVTIQYRLESR